MLQRYRKALRESKRQGNETEVIIAENFRKKISLEERKNDPSAVPINWDDPSLQDTDNLEARIKAWYEDKSLQNLDPWNGFKVVDC